MRAVDIIIKKRDGGTLTAQEIDFFVRGFTNGEIPDYQASAFAMAVLLNGMTNFETTDLTLSMARSGSTLDLSKVVDLAVDKHSSGGVGDKTSIAVMPMVAACGLAVGKMSGRGLGFSGGTLDKLESIPGYRVDLTTDEFLEQLKEKGIVLTGQSLDLAPADGKLYALRDVTGTVPSMPLIASSIMCKKIAAGAQAIVLDVKVGRGAFMQTLEEGRELAELMVDIGRLAGRKTVALLSDMNQPLGSAVGNALEVIESIETLRGRGPADFVEHCLHVAAHVLVLGRRASDLDEGRSLARKSIADGSALEKLRILVAAQGGDASYVDDVSRFKRAKFREEIKTPRSGFVSQVNARTVGEASVELGAGRAKKGDPINHAVGFLIYKKVGDEVREGETLCEVHADDAEKLQKAREAVLSAYQIGDEPVPPLPLFYE
ncbi:MAG: thymidine phosphorylase [Chloroflexi bacterium]|nr:thymidine phosphorylase [Chloroflexi bacterium CFX1]MCK6566210.1 thymidine phosphorylase [Anaerolineales bacterium]MCQ3953323.1 thymidine phosphorylase [Chloroflexota bacterium]MDL1919966.1 thymidine phosphorylase [Chloroflexi bacterium CFX5]NUQ59681.1 thymidine phosphorylase [Anaerolineales bacterium]